MKPATARTNPIFPFLGILRGTESSSQKLIDTAWLFVYSVLWNNQVFSAQEKSEAKGFIKKWLTSKYPRKSFLQFCQRIILARQNVHLLNADSLWLPSLWLDPDNAEGYSITGNWWHETKIIRCSLPRYKNEIKALAESVLEFSEEPTRKNFQYWRNYFLEKDEAVLLNLFTVFCSNHFFKISEQ